MNSLALQRLAIALAVTVFAGQHGQAQTQSQDATGGGSTRSALLSTMASNWDSGDFECAGTTGVEPTLLVIPTVGPCVGLQIALTFLEFNDKACSDDLFVSCTATTPDCDTTPVGGTCVNDVCTGNNNTECTDDSTCNAPPGGTCVETRVCTKDGETPCMRDSDCDPQPMGESCAFKQRHIDYTVICEAGPPAQLKSVGGLCLCNEPGQDCVNGVDFPDCDAVAQEFDETTPLTGEGVMVESEVQSGPPFPVTMRVGKAAAGDLALSWTANCFPNQNHAVYEGLLDQVATGNSLVAVPSIDDLISEVCIDNAPLNIEVITPLFGNTYYMVVPNNLKDCDGIGCTQIEGSYGKQLLPGMVEQERSAAMSMPCAPNQTLNADCE